MTREVHPIIHLFGQGAEVIDATGQKLQLDDAIAKLADWMELAQNRLNEDDRTMLAEIGAILYKEGLDRRMSRKS